MCQNKSYFHREKHLNLALYGKKYFILKQLMIFFCVISGKKLLFYSWFLAKICYLVIPKYIQWKIVKKMHIRCPGKLEKILNFLIKPTVSSRKNESRKHSYLHICAFNIVWTSFLFWLLIKGWFFSNSLFCNDCWLYQEKEEWVREVRITSKSNPGKWRGS